MAIGINPLILLSATENVCKFLSLLNEDGREPVNELNRRSRNCKFMRLPISLGMLPEIALCEREINHREVERLESDSGSDPPNLQLPSSKNSNCEEFANAVRNSQSFGSLASSKFPESWSQLISPKFPTSKRNNTTEIIIGELK